MCVYLSTPDKLLTKIPKSKTNSTCSIYNTSWAFQFWVIFILLSHNGIDWHSKNVILKRKKTKKKNRNSNIHLYLLFDVISNWNKFSFYCNWILRCLRTALNRRTNCFQKYENRYRFYFILHWKVKVCLSIP